MAKAAQLRNSSGQVLPIGAVLLGLGAGVLLLLGVLGDRAARIARADSVADSVALAAAADGPQPSPGSTQAAQTVAQVSHFELVSAEWTPLASGHCRVQVEVSESQALLQANNNFLANLLLSTPVTSKASAVSSQPCN